MIKISKAECGCARHLTLCVTQDIVSRLLGRNIRHEGSTLTLTEENIVQFFDQTVQLRSPLFCLETDSVCQNCLGFTESSLDPLDTKLSEAFASFYQDHVINRSILRLRAAKHFQTQEARMAALTAVRKDLLAAGIEF